MSANPSAPDWLHPSLRASFVAMPSDPNIPLTDEQLAYLFRGDRRALIDIARIACGLPPKFFLLSTHENAHQLTTPSEPIGDAQNYG